MKKKTYFYCIPLILLVVISSCEKDTILTYNLYIANTYADQGKYKFDIAPSVQFDFKL